MKIEYSHNLEKCIKSRDLKDYSIGIVDYIQLNENDKYVRLDYYTTFKPNERLSLTFEPFVFIIFIQTNTDDYYEKLWNMIKFFKQHIGENNEQFIHIKKYFFENIKKMINGFRDDGYWFNMYASRYDDIYITEYPDLSEKTEEFFMGMFDDNGEIIEEKIPLAKVKDTEEQRKCKDKLKS